MPNKIFVDTHYIVALINTRDSYHAKASELVDVFSRSSLVTTDAVLLEVGNALSRNYKRQAVEIIETLSTRPMSKSSVSRPNYGRKGSRFIVRTSTKNGV